MPQTAIHSESIKLALLVLIPIVGDAWPPIPQNVSAACLETTLSQPTTLVLLVLPVVLSVSMQMSAFSVI